MTKFFGHLLANCQYSCHRLSCHLWWGQGQQGTWNTQFCSVCLSIFVRYKAFWDPYTACSHLPSPVCASTTPPCHRWLTLLTGSLEGTVGRRAVAEPVLGDDQLLSTMSTCTQRSVWANADKCPTAGFFHLRELPICGRQMLFPVWLTDAPVVEILSWIQFRKMVDPHFSFTLDGASSFSTMPRNSGLNQAAKPKWPTGRHLVPYLGDPYWFFSFS